MSLEPNLNLSHASLRNLRTALDTKQVSATELAEFFLARAECALSLNAFLHIDRGLTLQQAREADLRGGPGDMLGVNAYRSHMVFPVAYPELRASPRFVKMCARLGLVAYWLETQTWPDCADAVPYDFRSECEKYRGYQTDKFFGG